MEGIEENDELSNYLASPLEKVQDPIAWWWDDRDVYPTLSKMAFDYLSIPGLFNSFHFESSMQLTESFLATSTAVERVFSQGRQVLHFTRNRLSPATIRGLMCFGNWCRKGLVRMSDVVDAVRCGSSKRRRSPSVCSSL